MKFWNFWKPQRFRLLLGVYYQDNQRFYGNCFTEIPVGLTDLIPPSGVFHWRDLASAREAVAKLLNYEGFDHMVAISKHKEWEILSVRITQIIPV